MKYLLIAATVSGCAPSTSVGETVVSLDADDFGTYGIVGAGGHLLRATSRAELRDPDGNVRWETACQNLCGFGAALDADGDVYTTEERADAYELAKRSAMGGEVVWSKQFAVRSAVTVIDDTGIVWLLAYATGEVDLGGGSITGGPGAVFAQFTPDGAYVASGRFPVAFDRIVQPAALPGGGIAVLSNESYNLFALSLDATIRWITPQRIADFALHADGQVTVEEINPDVYGDASLVHYDASHVERWRQPLETYGTLTPITGGGVVFASGDGLGNTTDVSTLAYFAADGSAAPREVITDWIALFKGPEADGFWYFAHDRGRGELVRRQLR